MSKKPSLVKQVQDVMDAKLAIGESKHEDKKAGIDSTKIYSWNTYRAYIKHACYFVQYCKAEHGCKTLSECRPYADDWIQSRVGLSAYTLKLEKAALAKLYGCKSSDFIDTDARSRDAITRSRGTAIRDKHFSLDKNAEIIAFAKSTGLRRAELEQIRGTDLVYRDGKPYLHVHTGAKGGRVRYAPVVGDIAVVEAACKRAGTEKVWGKVHSAMDVHSYRAVYATRIYQASARDFATCKSTPFWNKEHFNGKGKPKGGWDRDSVYLRRGSHKGEWLDKGAMLKASQALGHNRISVVGEHYIRT